VERTTGRTSEVTNILRTVGLTLLVVLSACASRDLDKGTRIAELSFAESSTQTNLVQLADGVADLVVAVPNGHCRPVNEETTVDVAISGPSLPIQQSMKMGELTWAYAEGSCDAYGYVYEAATRLSKKFDVTRGKHNVRVQLMLGMPEQRTATLWIIYGGRAPTTRMFPGKSDR
jgi:hypothetical protein